MNTKTVTITIKAARTNTFARKPEKAVCDSTGALLVLFQSKAKWAIAFVILIAGIYGLIFLR